MQKAEPLKCGMRNAECRNSQGQNGDWGPRNCGNDELGMQELKNGALKEGNEGKPSARGRVCVKRSRDIAPRCPRPRQRGRNKPRAACEPRPTLRRNLAARTARRAIPTFALNTYDADGCDRDG